MNCLLYSASALLIFIGFAHSYLGERYILIRLFKRGNLPELFGGVDFTRRTLRFAWHLTTVAWFGFAALLVSLSRETFTPHTVGWIISITFVVHGVIALVHSRGRHLSWVVFLSVALLSLLVSLD